MTVTMDAHVWAEEQFGQCDLKDERRTQRLVQVAASALSHPSGSLPEQTSDAADLKAAYRLFGCEDVTFEEIAGPHWAQTRRRPPGVYLVLNDTTEVDFGIRRKLRGMGPTGNGGGWGFLLHSALVVSGEGEAIFGLAGQKIRYRKPAPKGKLDATSETRPRVGAVGAGHRSSRSACGRVRWVHVMDRGADNFEVYCHCRQQQADWVVRVTQKQRGAIVPDGQSMALKRYLPTLPSCGNYELRLRARAAQPKRGHKPARKAQPARTAKVEVRFGPLRIPFPKQKSPYLKGLPPVPIAMWAVHAVEVDPPKDVEQVEWILLTSLPVAGFDEAWRILAYYEKRWLIEEYHKALKSGCRVESRQLQSKEGLERITALLSVVAVRLLQLKSAARTNPACPARTLVPLHWIKMLLAARKRSKLTVAMTIREFYREVAKLGGFLGRKSDGEPGWITIWRGWQKLYMFIHGAELAQAIK